jgi:hypothetical protein
MNKGSGTNARFNVLAERRVAVLGRLRSWIDVALVATVGSSVAVLTATPRDTNTV